MDRIAFPPYNRTKGCLYLINYICCFFFILILSRDVNGQQLEFKKIGSLEGLSHSTVYDITEDREGFMWFGTREGLNRFDGHELKVYYANTEGEEGNGPSSDQVNALLAARGQLFIGTSKGLDVYSPQNERFRSEFNGKSLEVSVNTMAKGENGLIYIGTSKGLYTLDKENELRLLLAQPGVRGLSPYKRGLFWVAFNKRIVLINELGKVVKEYHTKTERVANAGSESTHVIFKDSRNKTWLGTSRGLFLYDEVMDDFIFHPLTDSMALEANMVRTIAEDQDRNLWIGTESGLFIYDQQEQIRHYSHSLLNNGHSLSDKAVYSVFINDEGMAWVGTYFGGVNYTKPKGAGFHILSPGRDGQSLHGKAVSQIISAGTRQLWIGTEDGGISIYDRNSGEYRYLTQENGLSSNNVHALLKDKGGAIWIGTFLGGVSKYEPETGRFTYYKHDPGKVGTISNNNVYAFLQDRKGKIWVGTQFGLNIYKEGSNSFELFKPETFGNKFIYDLHEDSGGDLWICTRYSGIFRYVSEKNKIVNYTGNNGLTSNEIISVAEDSEGNLWFGTLNGGLLRWDKPTGSFSHIGKTDGLPNDNVYGIVESPDEQIWVSTNKGLSKYDPETRSIVNYNAQDGLPTNQFNFKSAFKDQQGRLYFGSIKGLIYFHPDSLISRSSTPDIQFTGFKLFNKDISITADGPLKKHINFVDSLVLKSNENAFSFEFTALNFKQNNFAYKLEGLDNSWNEVGTNRSATYTNLSPGEYTFRLQTLPLNQGNERKIFMKIQPPTWQTTWAYAIYLLLFGAGLVGLWKFQRFVHEQKLAVRLEKVEKEKIKELNLHKLNFFTFISHEFKTPLTLIIASIEKHFKQYPGGANSMELTAVKKSAAKLQHLVTQLMEFRKTESDVSKAAFKKGDIILFLKDTFKAFSPLLEEKKLEFTCKCEFMEYTCYFDPDKFEMIVTNLLSNAIKNTPENGTIHVSIGISNSLDAENRSQLELLIIDSGQGIAQKDLQQVFHPFFKSGNHGKSRWQGSSGIGLALVYNLTRLLDGQVEMESELNKGTRVQVNIPLVLKVKEEAGEIPQIMGNRNVKIDPDVILEDHRIPEESEEGTGARDLSILIVEDNRQIMKFLQQHFSGRFRTITATNGADGLKKLEKHLPDLIISDLAMPEMDGIGFCKSVRKDPRTSHIPFLVLSGKTEKHLRMEALRVGANAYINKPFSVDELDLIIRNLVVTNQGRFKRFAGIPVKKFQGSPANNQVEEFLKRFNDLVNENYGDPSFNIEDLSSKMGISRSLLHMKIKKFTGSSASEYLKKLRLTKAVELLALGRNVGEVAYSVGYSDPNYFSRVFKKEFKRSPTSYKDEVSEKYSPEVDG